MAILRWRPGSPVLDRWEPFRELGEIQQEMNRVFDGFFGRSTPAAAFDRMWAPAVDMYETKEEVVVTAELPGMSDKDVHVSITGEVLTLRGERRSEQEVRQDNYYCGERWFGKFERSLPLPIPVQADRVTAAYRDGVLTVKLPKAEEIRPKEIKIDVL